MFVCAIPPLLLVLPPALIAAGFFVFGWINILAAYSKYYSASMPLTYQQRRQLASSFVVSGELQKPPASLNDAEKAAFEFFPELKKAELHVIKGFVAILGLFAYVGILNFFGLI